MEKFGYIVKEVYHHDWLQDIIDNDEDFMEDEGAFQVVNAKEYIYLDLQDYRKLLKDHDIFVHDFINNSFVKYVIFRFMDNELYIEDYKLIVKNNQLSLDMTGSKVIPYHAFPDKCLYIACGYNKIIHLVLDSRLYYKYTDIVSTWGTDKKRLISYLKQISKYRRRDIIIITRIPVYRFSYAVFGGCSLKIERFIFRYINSMSKNLRDYVSYIMRLSKGDNWYYDNNLNFIGKRSIYRDESSYTIDDILDYDVYQKIMMIKSRASKRISSNFLKLFSKLR